MHVAQNPAVTQLRQQISEMAGKFTELTRMSSLDLMRVVNDADRHTETYREAAARCFTLCVRLEEIAPVYRGIDDPCFGV